MSLGYTVDGKRHKRKVSATTKAAVLDKLRDLHRDLDQGIVPKAGQASYTCDSYLSQFPSHVSCGAPRRMANASKGRERCNNR